MKKLFPLLVVILLTACSCEKKVVDRKVRQQSIYDQQVIASLCVSAAREEASFAAFRSNPFFHLLFEDLSFEQGQQCLEWIRARDPDLLDKMEIFANNDPLGSPPVFSYGLQAKVSPSTLRYVQVLADLRRTFGDLNGLRVIEIGGGYGGQCKILCDQFHFAKYTIVDLPACVELTSKFLDRSGVQGVACLTMDQLPDDAEYDLVISNCGFSAFNQRCQTLFFDKILAKSHRGFLICDVFPKHFGVTPYSKEELMKKGKKHQIAFAIAEPQPSCFHDQYVLTWNINKTNN